MLLAVIGNPIAHSLSPQIHEAFAAQFGLAIDYRRIRAHDLRFSAEALRAAGARGCNVTVPFKPDAFAYCDRVSERARRARAVNTIVFEAQARHGDNTDGIGLVRDLVHNLSLELGGRRILVLGAGGAARGIVAPLLEQQPAQLHIANRTPARALDLAARFADLGPVSGAGLDGFPAPAFDLVINATAASLDGAGLALPTELLADGGAAYDLVYGENARAFLRWAEDAGAAMGADGLGMLVEQAAESFFAWTGRRPRTQPVLAALRSA